MKLIVIEGIDGSGKQTQSEMLVSALQNKGYSAIGLHFPNYESASSGLVKMYLGGEFGESANAINPYVASSFYAVDRAATFARKALHYDFVICDRYTTSNMIHQGAKLLGEERDRFLDWAMDYEYNLLGIPRPDKVIFLDVNIDITKKLTMERKLKNGLGKDIHEADTEYMERCYDSAIYCVEKFGWDRINCVENGGMLGVGEIHEKIKTLVNIEGMNNEY